VLAFTAAAAADATREAGIAHGFLAAAARAAASGV
jgi:hypothetical protein